MLHTKYQGSGLYGYRQDDISCSSIYRVRKGTKIRNQYKQVPHLTQNTTWESGKSTIKHHEHEPRGQACAKHLTPGAEPFFGPRGIICKLGRGPLDGAKYQISRL